MARTSASTVGVMVIAGLLWASVGASADPAKLKLGMLAPLAAFYDAECWVHAFELAITHVNADSSLLPSTTLSGAVFDTKGKRGPAVQGTMSLLCELEGQTNATCTPADVFIGPCFSANAIVSQAVAANLYDVAQVSPTATTPDLSDKTLYPTFSRVRSPVQFEGQVLAEFVAKTGWSSMNILYSSHELDMATATEFWVSLPANVTIQSMDMYTKPDINKPPGTDNLSDDLTKHLQQIKASQSYIVFMSIRSWDIPMVFEALQKEDMIGPPWVYIVPSGVVQSLDYYVDQSALYAGIVGLFNLNRNQSAPAFQQFNEEWTAAKLSCSNHTVPSANTARTYDSVMLVARAYSSALASAKAARGADAVPTTTELTAAVRSTQFVGASGEVRLSNTGDRLPYLGIGYMPKADPEDPKNPLHPVQVGSFTPLSGMAVDLSAIIWPSGTTSLPSDGPESYLTNTGLQALAIFVSSAVMLEAVCFSIAAFWLRKNKTMRWSSPLFMQLICFGSIMATVGMMVYVAAPVTSSSCAAILWFPSMARVLVMGCLFAKTHRVYKLFTNKSLKKIVISDLDVAKRVTLVVVPFLVFYAVWQFVSPWAPVVQETPIASNGERFTYLQCDSEYSVQFEITGGVFLLVLLLWGGFLAFETRRVPAGFNESRHIMLAIYNGLLVLMIAGGLGIVLRQMPDAALMLRVISELEPVAFTLAALFVPKFFYIYKKKAHNDLLRKAGGAATVAKRHKEELKKLELQLVKEKRAGNLLKQEVARLKKQLATPDHFPARSSATGGRGGEFAHLNPLLAVEPGAAGAGAGAGASAGGADMA